MVSNSRPRWVRLNLTALWRSGTKATSVAILLVRKSHRQQHPAPQVYTSIESPLDPGSARCTAYAGTSRIQPYRAHMSLYELI